MLLNGARKMIDGIKAYNQFVLWKLIQVEGEPKPRKVPVRYDKYDLTIGTNPKTGQPTVYGGSDPHDVNNWLTYENSKAWADHLDCGYGFVFTENDPFVFVDLDGCLTPDGQWNSFSQEILAMFPGAGVEVSQSGTGLHIVGRAQIAANHRKKVKGHLDDGSPWEIEFYSRGRFMAIGSNQIGDSNADVSNGVARMIAAYMPGDAGVSADWTDEADPEYGGPDDDQELIKRMLTRKPNAAQSFGNHATLQDLWLCNVDVLSVAYPSAKDDIFDRSSAVQALCNHLAFWTGKNCVRIDRLFRQSGLMYWKWDRDEYKVDGFLHKTVTGAIATCKNVYKPTVKTPEAAQHEPVDASPIEVGKLGVSLRNGFQFLTITEQEKHFKGCTYIIELHRVLTSDGSLLSAEQFKAVYGGYEFQIDNLAKTTKCPWEAFTASRIADFPKAHNTCFRPEHTFGEPIDQEGKTLINTYIPAVVKRTPGDVAPFLDCLQKLLPNINDRNILIAYAAACVQYPGSKFQWCPLLQGVQGNGKSLIATCVSKAVGERYSHFPKASDLANKFNGWIQNKLFIGVEEVYVTDRREVLDELKPLVTNKRIEIQSKGRDQVTGDNRANFIMCSNHRDAIMKTRDDRRYSVFFTAQQYFEDFARDGMDGMYFPKLYTWLAKGGFEHVSHYLSVYPIPIELNPAVEHGGHAHRAPNTTSTEDAILASLGRVEQYVKDAIEEEQAGLRGGWVSTVAVDRVFKDKGVKISPNKRGEILESLGYIRHMWLPKGRASNTIMQEDGKRPIIFVKRGSGLNDEKEPAKIVFSYMTAQGYLAPAQVVPITAPPALAPGVIKS